MTSGSWANSGGSRAGGFCDALRDVLGGWAASGVDALSLRGFLSSGDMLDDREPALLALALDATLAGSFFPLAPPVEAGRSSRFTSFIFAVVACSSSSIKRCEKGEEREGGTGAHAR